MELGRVECVLLVKDELWTTWPLPIDRPHRLVEFFLVQPPQCILRENENDLLVIFGADVFEVRKENVVHARIVLVIKLKLQSHYRTILHSKDRVR